LRRDSGIQSLTTMGMFGTVSFSTGQAD
jgi:hypothetical protein